jgi:hypothetical protein
MRRIPVRQSSVTSTVEEGWEEVACGATRVRGAHVAHGGSGSRVAGGVGPVGAWPAPARARADDERGGHRGGLRPPRGCCACGGLAAHGGLTAAPSRR